VRQVFPCDDHLVEGLGISLAPKHERKYHQKRTVLNVCGSPLWCILTRWIRTFEHPETDGSPMAGREPESAYDFGRTSLIPQIFFSSCRYSWNAGIGWFDIDARTYDSVEGALGRNGLNAHAIQILDKPRQVFALQAWNSTSIPFTAKEVDETLVELRRCSVEAAELF